jgi:20S proteasome subunit beta 7
MPMSFAIKTNDSIIFGANPIACYGSSLYSDNVDRFTQLGNNFVFSASGDYSDFMKISEELNEMWYKESVYEGVQNVNVEKYANYTQNLCYARRNKVDPFLIDGAIGGFDQNGNNRLYYVDQFGMFLEKNYVCSGVGNYMLPALVGTSI